MAAPADPGDTDEDDDLDASEQEAPADRGEASDEAASDEAASDEAASDEAASNEAASDDGEDQPTGAARRRRRRRRKKREPRRRPLDDDGRERPQFLLDFPAHPELDRLVAAFENGNYRLVRQAAPELAESTDDPVVRDAALELRRRIEPDPLARYLLLISVALLLFLVLYFYSTQPDVHAH